MLAQREDRALLLTLDDRPLRRRGDASEKDVGR